MLINHFKAAATNQELPNQLVVPIIHIPRGTKPSEISFGLELVVTRGFLSLGSSKTRKEVQINSCPLRQIMYAAHIQVSDVSIKSRVLILLFSSLDWINKRKARRVTTAISSISFDGYKWSHIIFSTNLSNFVSVRESVTWIRHQANWTVVFYVVVIVGMLTLFV